LDKRKFLTAEKAEDFAEDAKIFLRDFCADLCDPLRLSLITSYPKSATDHYWCWLVSSVDTLTQPARARCETRRAPRPALRIGTSRRHRSNQRRWRCGCRGTRARYTNQSTVPWCNSSKYH